MDGSETQSPHPYYMRYVGPADQYDLMGASQFRLLTTLGLRSCHSLLDYGCGSLRAGKFFIPYLEPGRYFGIEPNRRLIEESIERQVGRDLIRLKQPDFSFNDDFSVPFPRKFDFILAQSIFSHTDAHTTRTALGHLKAALHPGGLAAVTFREGNQDFAGTGWVYPGTVAYTPKTIRSFAARAGLFPRRIPWYHPRQTWYLLARDRRRLPKPLMASHLSGAVLFVPEFTDSWHPIAKLPARLRQRISDLLPRRVRERVWKSMVG